ncbi:MAG: hypothetical protein GKR90_23765 [Pseudomonadales bacterium]|nr:hypothetical protein [Pseudomonadales bacterium]
MSKILALILLLLAFCHAHGATAEPHEERPFECVAPVRPEDDQNDALWQRFLAEIDAFRNCVNQDMQWHQAASVAHQARARAAVEAWNAFVTSSLNAPEDFPFPPEE